MCPFSCLRIPCDTKEQSNSTHRPKMTPHIRWSDDCKTTRNARPPIIRKLPYPHTTEGHRSRPYKDLKYEYAACIELYVLGTLRPHVRWSNDCKTSKNAKPPFIRKVQCSHSTKEKYWRACADSKCRYAACNEFYALGTLHSHVHWWENWISSSMRMLKIPTVCEYSNYDDRRVKAAAYERYAPSSRSTKRQRISGYLGISEWHFCRRFPHLDEDLRYKRWTKQVGHEIKMWAKAVLGRGPDIQLPSPGEERFAM